MGVALPFADQSTSKRPETSHYFSPHFLSTRSHTSSMVRSLLSLPS